MIYLRQPQTIPPHLEAVDTISDGQYTVYFCHLGYPEEYNILFFLCGTDHPEGGIHHETACLACAIIANNKWEGFLSESKNPIPIFAGPDEILRKTIYYFHVINQNESEPYPIVPLFDQWKFPHDHLPPIWINSRENASNIIDICRSNGFMATIHCDKTCRMSDYEEGCQVSYIIPYKEHSWFKMNQMWMYAKNKKLTEAITDVNNLILLRADLHLCFDDQNFIWVPKGNNGQQAFVIHILTQSKKLTSHYQNVKLHNISSISREYLFARFAYSIFPLLKHFFDIDIDIEIRVVVQNNEGILEDRNMKAEELKNLMKRKSYLRNSSPKRLRSIIENNNLEIINNSIQKNWCWNEKENNRNVDRSTMDILPSSNILCFNVLENSNASSISNSYHTSQLYKNKNSSGDSKTNLNLGLKIEQEGSSVSRNDTEADMNMMINKYLMEERKRSDPEGHWKKELEWRERAIGRILRPEEIGLFYTISGYDERDDLEYISPSPTKND